MDAKGAIKWAMKQEHINGAELSRRLHLSSGYMGELLSKRQDVKAGTLARIAAALGYELVLKRGPVEVHITE